MSPLVSLLRRFPPVQYAVGYGSGVVKQLGYGDAERPMVDLLLVVRSAVEWHRENLSRNWSHYSGLRWLGARAVAHVQRKPAGLYYNTSVVVDGVRLKYGVIEQAALEYDLTHWRTLYASGRLHKPVVVLQQSVDLAPFLQRNLDHAVTVAASMLPARFTAQQLFIAITGLSYLGDFRMKVGENPNKVANIVHANLERFHKLYSSVLDESPFVRRASRSSIASADDEGGELERVDDAIGVRQMLMAFPAGARHALQRAGVSGEAFACMNADQRRAAVEAAVAEVVAPAAAQQSAKGVLTAGLAVSAQYGLDKLRKRMGALR